jgi:hypothetical protein
MCIILLLSVGALHCIYDRLRVLGEYSQVAVTLDFAEPIASYWAGGGEGEERQRKIYADKEVGERAKEEAKKVARPGTTGAHANEVSEVEDESKRDEGSLKQ